LTTSTAWESRELVDSWEAFVACSIRHFQDESRQSGIYVSPTYTSPEKGPCEDQYSIVSELTRSSVGSQPSKRGGGVQANFRERVLTRDGWKCVFCGNDEPTELQAAHVVDVAYANGHCIDKSFYGRYGLSNVHETCNGLTLCEPCHRVFDAQLCFILATDGQSAKYRVVVADAVLTQHGENLDKLRSRWEPLHWKAVALPGDERARAQFPSKELFAFRKETFERKAKEREEKRQENPFVCELCAFRTSTERGTSRHRGSNKCLRRAGSRSVFLFLSSLNSARKSPKAGKSRTPFFNPKRPSTTQKYRK
jgi:hypothetical protein